MKSKPAINAQRKRQMLTDCQWTEWNIFQKKNRFRLKKNCSNNKWRQCWVNVHVLFLYMTKKRFERSNFVVTTEIIDVKLNLTFTIPFTSRLLSKWILFPHPKEPFARRKCVVNRNLSKNNRATTQSKRDREQSRCWIKC